MIYRVSIPLETPCCLNLSPTTRKIYYSPYPTSIRTWTSARIIGSLSLGQLRVRGQLRAAPRMCSRLGFLPLLDTRVAFVAAAVALSNPARLLLPMGSFCSMEPVAIVPGALNPTNALSVRVSFLPTSSMHSWPRTLTLPP